MSQIRATEIKLCKVRFGWRAHLIDTRGRDVIRHIWRPTRNGAYTVMMRLREHYIWGYSW